MLAVLVAVLGALSGLVSVQLFPHPLVHPSKFHGVSLLIAPAAAGIVMSLIGRLLRSRGRQTVPIESFRLGFTFAFAMTVVRLLLAR